MTISLELDPLGLTALQQEAKALGVTPEQLAAEIVRRHLLDRSTDATFRAALAESMKENEELLRRLTP